MGKKSTYIKKVIISLWYGFLEIIYPIESYCIICGKEGYNGICDYCISKIKQIEYIIPGEDKMIINSYGHYGGVLKKLILRLKYYNDFTAGDILAELLEKYIRENIDYSEYVISYIPMSKKSKKKRGFNQCEYIANKVAYSLSIRNVSILYKCKETKEQKRLLRQERFENIKNAFGIYEEKIKKIENVILIDDVTTTGATMIEAFKILKKYGIKQIKLLTLAKSHI
ncbi:ComF family protein [Clostridium sp. SM-530-WT-3G]|uniref:ComF family protein n=1 Tax=Clostridium sp. SM-530-WT-3G TaxID=2725303 RepID=UPI00145E2559|nr:ComF family protein [Clostridium sp. SM-530-WT-3G]NME82666.1 ComF family protein [Clostridium sp. SM-530-WT-3G]